METVVILGTSAASSAGVQTRQTLVCLLGTINRAPCASLLPGFEMVKAVVLMKIHVEVG